MRAALGILVVTLWTMVAPAQAEAVSASERFQQIYEKDWEFRLTEFPRMATSSGDHRFDDRLVSVTEADQRRRYEFRKGILAELTEVDADQMSTAEQVNVAIFRRQIESAIEDYETGAYLIPMNSDWGFHIGLARLPTSAPLRDVEDYRNYLSRLSQVPRVMGEYTELMREGLRRGMTLPKVVLEGRDNAIKTHIVDAEESVFFAPFKDMPDTIGPADRRELADQGRSVVNDQVVPAYAKFLAFFNDEYQPGARQSLAATELPGGERFYAGQVRYYTTLDLSAKAIHEIGLKEVARIRGEMQDIINQVEFEGEFADFIEYLRTDSRFYAETPRELLGAAMYYAKRMDGQLPSLFKTLPRQPYGVAPVPDDLAPFFTGGRYVGAPIDSTRPGYYWVNTYDLKSRPLYTLPALTLHEAVPGHHLQNALAQERGEQPPFRRGDYISAYGEGWGLYSEYLGVEAGIYETPYDHFGRLTYEMWRACRLVVDTGIHAFGWGRQQAIDYLAGNTALSMHEVTTEIDRYISWPAQALSYKLGELKIKELRARASAALGSRFDLREFHDVVLSEGSVPLPVLEQSVDRWIAAQAE
jgi:uncharacterized protein (DUF885 family)